MLFRNRRRLLQLIALTSSVVMGFASSLMAASAASLLRLSTDPYPNISSQHATEVEPDTYAFGSTIVSAFQVGRFFSGGSSNIGFATSTNGGSSWTNGFLPSSTIYATPAGTYPRASDPSVAYDPKHGAWMISWLGVVTPTGPVDVVVSRSTDGGLSWGAPVTVNATGHFDDKNWTVCDTTASSSFFGNCYTEFDDASLGDLEQMSTSRDGGLTWGAALHTVNKVHGIGGQPLVQPNGTVIVPFNGFRGRKGFSVAAFSSANGGASWSAASTVAPVFFHHAAGGIRDSIPLPSAEMDRSGKVYVVWQDCRFEPMCSASDSVLSTSSDGVNWTDPVRIPVDSVGSGVDHFFPAIAVDRSTSGNTAHIVLIYYFYSNTNCTSSTCQLSVGNTSSTNGGATWAGGTQLAGPMSLSWLPNTSQGTMVGDYMSTSFSGAVAYPAFVVANAPSGVVFDEAIYTVSGGLAASGGLLSATGQSSSQASSGLEAATTTSQ
jgi:hypothetical protein